MRIYRPSYAWILQKVFIMSQVKREWHIKAQQFSLHYQINPNKRPFVVTEAFALSSPFRKNNSPFMANAISKTGWGKKEHKMSSVVLAVLIENACVSIFICFTFQMTAEEPDGPSRRCQAPPTRGGSWVSSPSNGAEAGMREKKGDPSLKTLCAIVLIHAFVWPV